MKTIIGLSFILAVSLAQAGQKISISTRTGKRIENSRNCTEVQPTRYAKATANFTDYTQVKNPVDGSVTSKLEILCQQVSGTFPVYEFPAGSNCISFTDDGTVAQCLFNDSNGKPATANVAGVIYQDGGSKTFTTYMDSYASTTPNADYNAVTVFDPLLQKIQLSAGSGGLSANDPLLVDHVQALVLIEDGAR